jgi:hypothetical protein
MRVLTLVTSLVAFSTIFPATGNVHAAQIFAPRLYVSPSAVRVGQYVSFRVSSPRWPRPMSAYVTFRSAHYLQNASKMPYKLRCSCFQQGFRLTKNTFGRDVATVHAWLAWGNHPRHSRQLNAVAFTIVGVPTPTATPVATFTATSSLCATLECTPTPVRAVLPTATPTVTPAIN